MQEAMNLISGNIYFTWLALFIFFSGFCFAYPVNQLNIKFLMWFPSWFVRTLSRFVNPRASFIRIFLIIFLFNSISIGIYLTLGLFLLLPFIIAFLTGMNIGLTIFMPQSYGAPPRVMGAGDMFRLMVFSTAVLFIETIVFSVALGMGMSLGVAVSAVSNANPSANVASATYIAELLSLRLQAYMLICVPALAVSAFLEASIIKGA